MTKADFIEFKVKQPLEQDIFYSNVYYNNKTKREVYTSWEIINDKDLEDTIKKIDHISINNNEIVFEIDHISWEENCQKIQKLYDYLLRENIPNVIYFSGNKSIHIHVWFDLKKISKELGIRLFDKNIKIYDMREHLFNKIIKKVELEVKDFDYGLIEKKYVKDKSKGSLVRCVGGKRYLNEKQVEGTNFKAGQISYCSYLNKIPKDKPYITKEEEVVYSPTDNLQIWNVPEEMLQDIDIYNTKRENTKKGITYRNFDKGTKYIIEEGVGEGKRNEMRFQIFKRCKDYKMTVEEIRAIMLEFNNNCKPPDLEKVVLAHFEQMKKQPGLFTEGFKELKDRTVKIKVIRYNKGEEAKFIFYLKSEQLDDEGENQIVEIMLNKDTVNSFSKFQNEYIAQMLEICPLSDKYYKQTYLQWCLKSGEIEFELIDEAMTERSQSVSDILNRIGDCQIVNDTVRELEMSPRLVLYKPDLHPNTIFVPTHLIDRIKKEKKININSESLAQAMKEYICDISRPMRLRGNNKQIRFWSLDKKKLEEYLGKELIVAEDDKEEKLIDNKEEELEI